MVKKYVVTVGGGGCAKQVLGDRAVQFNYSFFSAFIFKGTRDVFYISVPGECLGRCRLRYAAMFLLFCDLVCDPLTYFVVNNITFSL